MWSGQWVAVVATAGLALWSAPVRAQDAAGERALDSLLAVQVSAAARYDQTAAEAPASVTVVTAEEIHAFGWRTLADVLAGVRGFYTSDDRNYAYVGVRGFGRPTDYNDRLLLLLDGLPVNDAYYGAAPAGLDLGVDLRSLDRIEIVRGPGSALYGSNAMLGVINLVTRDPARHEHVIARASGGNDGLHAGSVELSDGGDDVSVWASVGRARSAGESLYFPELADGSVGMDGEEATHARVRAAWRDLEASARLSRRWKTIPTGPWGTSLHDPRARTLDARSDVDLAWSPRLGTTRRVDLRASLGRYRYEGYYPYVDGTFSDDANDVRSARLAGQLVWDLRAEDRLMVGGEWRHHSKALYRAADATEEYFRGDVPYDEWGVMAQDEHHLTAHLVLTGGVRYDQSELGFGRGTVRGAAVWTPSATNTVKLLYGKAFRAPNVFERFYEDGYGSFVANAHLAPEVARTLELVWERRVAGPLWATGAVFDTDIDGLIDSEVAEDGTSTFTNRDHMEGAGFETELQGRWSGGRLLRLSYSWTRGTLDGDVEPSNAPAHIVRGAFALPLGPVRFASEARFESGRLTLRDTRTDDAFLLDARLTADGIVGGLGVWAGGHNLLDADYAVPGGIEHEQSVIPQPRRRIEVGAEWRY